MKTSRISCTEPAFLMSSTDSNPQAEQQKRTLPL